MKFDLEVIMINVLDGTEYKTEILGKEVPWTSRLIAIRACVGSWPGDDADSNMRYDLGGLANRLKDAGDSIEILPEEATILKDRIGHLFSSDIVFATHNLLNG